MKQARRLGNYRWHQEVVTLTRVVLGSRSSLGVDPWRLVGESKKNTPEIRASEALLRGTKFSRGVGERQNTQESREVVFLCNAFKNQNCAPQNPS